MSANVSQIGAGETLESTASTLQGKAVALRSLSNGRDLVSLILDLHVLEDEMVHQMFYFVVVDSTDYSNIVFVFAYLVFIAMKDFA